MKTEKHGGNIYEYDNKVLDFSANLNPLGMPEDIKKAVCESVKFCESYPDPKCRVLRGMISEYHQVDKQRICCGNGGADIIFRTVMALQPKRILIIAPAFSEYEEAARLARCNVRYHLLHEENGFCAGEEVVDSISEDIDMVFVASPANPTGIPVRREVLRRMADKCRDCRAYLFIDECFTEFLEEEEEYSLMSEAGERQEVIILKSFTKLYAMAGLRLGYCVCGSADTAQKIRNCMQSWPVSTAASAAGIAALGIKGFAERTRGYIAIEREYLKEMLRLSGCKVFDSRANYVFFKCDPGLDEKLLNKGILIRNCSNYYGLREGFYRIAVRTHEENEMLSDRLLQL